MPTCVPLWRSAGLSQALFSKLGGTRLAGYVAWLFIFLKNVNANAKLVQERR